MAAPRSSPIAAIVTTKIKQVARFVRQCAGTSQDGSSLEFIAAIAGKQCYIQDASGRGLWGVIHGIGWTCSQNVSSLALTVWELWYFEDLEEKDHWPTDRPNDRGVCRTAPVTPCLIKTSLLRRLQAQTLPDTTRPTGKLRFIQQNRRKFWTYNAIELSFTIKNVLNLCDIAHFMTGRNISNHLGMGDL